jgi:tetratricopeptide (TPR) repeat protein
MPDARIFVSYSHRGNGPRWKDALLGALHVFETHNLLDVWQDGRIRVSSFWDDDIKRAMRAARLAVVLLTDEALRSNYILGVELPFLAERQRNEGLPVFPIVCEPCDWKSHDWLQATQIPNESEPLSGLSQNQIDGVFRFLAAEIAVRISRDTFSVNTQFQASDEPVHLYLDRFPLSQGRARAETLVGREQELALLDLAYAHPHTTVGSLVAWGGVGKSMLVRHWLQRLERAGWLGMRRVYAWSFYSQGTKEDRQASEDAFLAHALEWFGVKCEPTLPPWDKGRLLADAVVRERALLVLDGVEPLQYPPGPMGGRLRAPGVQSLLRQLARNATVGDHPCLCLVTTREPLVDLGDFERRPNASWGSVLCINLGNLTEDAGAALLHHAGATRAGAAAIKPDDAELLAASREVEGHALTLNMLGRFLARAHGGDVRRRDLVKFEEADRKEQGGTTFKMLAAFEDWFGRGGEFEMRSLAVLRILGLFDRPADACCLAALRQPPAIAGLTDALFTTKLDGDASEATVQPLPDEGWNAATSFLADFGLVVVHAHDDHHQRLLDCHPLIREHFATKLREDSLHEVWRSAHDRLFEYLTNVTPDRASPTLEDLQPLYQAVNHGCQAGRHEEARLKVFWQRILRGNEHYSWRQLGAVTEDLSALGSFFDRAWDQPAQALPAYSKALVLGQSALCLFTAGRLQEALPPMQEAAGLMFDLEHWQQASIATGNLCDLQWVLGDLEEAERIAEMALSFARSSNDAGQIITRLTMAARCCVERGKSQEALAYFEEAEARLGGLGVWPPVLFGLPGWSYCDALVSGLEEGSWGMFLARRKVTRLRDGLTWRREDQTVMTAEQRTSMLRVRKEIEERATRSQNRIRGKIGPLEDALDHLTLARTALYCAVLESEIHRNVISRDAGLFPPTTKLAGDSGCEDLRLARTHLTDAMECFHRAGQSQHIPRGLLALAWLRFLEGDGGGSRLALDEAWDIAERGPMQLYMADIHLYRVRLFFRESPYPWRSPQDDLAAAEKLIGECGYHRRDYELTDAMHAILSS